MKKSKKEKKSLATTFIDDFEVQNWKLMQKTKLELSSKSGHIFALYTFDFLFCHVVLGPSVVAYWRGIWDYSLIWLDSGLCWGDLTFSHLLCLGLGLLVTGGVDLFHHNILLLAGDVGSVKHSIIRHLFSVIWGSVDIIMWKGLWEGIDHWFGQGLEQSGVTFTIGLSILVVSRSLKSALSMPIGIVVDNPGDHISVGTFLDTGPKDSYMRRSIDCLASRIVEVGVILIWHGLWTFTDAVTEEVYEMSHTESSFFSLFIGWCGGLLMFLLQFPLLKMFQSSDSNDLSQYFFLLLNFIFTLVGVFITISSFRGSWYLLGIYYIPAYPVASLVSGQVIGLLVLLTFRCSSCLHAGVYRDFPSEGVSISFHHTVYFYIKNINERFSDDADGDSKEDASDNLMNGRTDGLGSV